MPQLWEIVGAEYDQPLHLLGVMAELQVGVAEEGEREQLLREWLDRVGREPEAWMIAVLAGPTLVGRDLLEEIERG